MCGVYGVWRFDGQPVDRAKLQQANTTLRHRGPDDEGYLLAETASGRTLLCGGDNSDARLNLPLLTDAPPGRHDLALAFRRLAILDLSPAGHQPMVSADGRCWIVFNGEVYNYVELRQELATLGHRFVSNSDTEVILAAYCQWGSECLRRFNGMWGLAIWDSTRRELFLARDRFGVKPLYYVRDRNHIAFASEIKALVGRHGVAFAPADAALYRYIVSGVLPSPRQGDTFFTGVAALPPGCWLKVCADGATAMQRYYDLPLTEGRSAVSNPAQVVEDFRSLFTDAVRLRLRADVPIGTCLSGGVDSSSIVSVVNRLMREGGVAAEQIGERQKTFSAVYTSEGRYNEREYIEIALQTTGAAGNFTYPTVERLLNDLERLVWRQEEPFGSTSIFAQWCVMEKVRESGVTVLLDGQGADEALGGYRPFAPFLSDLLSQLQFRRMAHELGQIAANTGWSQLDWFKRALLWQLPAAWRSALARQAKTPPLGRALLDPGFAARCAGLPPAAPQSLARQSLSQHLYDQVMETSLPHLLRYEDRNSMAFSIEARVPFVDYRMMEFSFNQAADLRIRDGWTKWILRRAMADLVPGKILWRKDKIGFETPQQEWLRSLAQASPDLFGQQALSREYLDLNAVRQQMPSLLNENASNQSLLWRLINLELWLRVWRKDEHAG